MQSKKSWLYVNSGCMSALSDLLISGDEFSHEVIINCLNYYCKSKNLMFLKNKVHLVKFHRMFHDEKVLKVYFLRNPPLFQF